VITHNQTQQPVEHGATFDTSALCDLFHQWGENPTLHQLLSKLLALLYLLGTLHVSAATLPFFNVVERASGSFNDHIIIPLVSYENNIYSKGTHITIHRSSDPTCCPVHAFNNWKR